MDTQYLAKAPARSFSASHRWKVLGVGVAANAAFSAVAAGIPTTAVWMRTGYQLGNAQLGLVLGATGLGIALSELPWGVATDRFGDRPVLVAGLVGTALTLLTMGLCLAPSPGSIPALALLVVAMALVGLLGGSVNGSSGRAIMSWFKEGERGVAMSIRQTAVPLGGGIGASLLPWLASTHGFAAVYSVLALMCATPAVFALRWLHEPPHTGADPTSKPAAVTTERSALHEPQIWRVAIGIAALCMPQIAILTFATVFLHDFGHLGTAGISTAMASLQVGAIVMRVWSGRYTDRRGNRRAYLRGSTIVAAASFAALAGSVALGHALPFAVIVATIVIAGVCVSAWHGVAYAELATLAGPARAGTALGMANALVYAGLFLVPLLLPHLLAATSWTLVWFIGGLIALAVYPLFPQPAHR
ncbi:MFS transporter [Trinickia soli]|uniref:MFS transporter n=1 Tax=Trinickia soli TaxID=380675 RepID=A0A2N7WG57_9BURK|nr:MFS transporter [Trinickia soli]PMS28344.1 MFS transporter [Trinickia soli]CAB3667917.1 putative MFS-type transporter [Trinickia soli]